MKNNPATAGSQPIRLAAFPWFRKEDFTRIKAMMADRHVLHDTWEGWHTAAQEGVKQFEARGHLVVKAVLLPDEYAAWCKGRGLALNAQSRSEFATSVAIKQHGQTH